MKNYLIYSLALGIMVLLSWSRGYAQENNLRVLLITGGHGFEEESFYDVFDAMQNITYDTAVQPQANVLIASPDVDEYDVLVFYDMFDTIAPAQQKVYIDLLHQGKAMIFMHHALVSYQNWEEFKHIVGGKYYENPGVVQGDTIRSNYEHDVSIPVKVADKTHPVTAGIPDFDIFDETYGHCEILPTVKPLLSTTHPKSMPYLAWINRYGNSEVLYIQLGHGPEAYRNPHYRQLLQQAIEWSADRHSRFSSNRNH